VTEQSEHLSNAQIENYGIRTSGAGPDAAQRDEHQRVNHQSIDDQPIDDQPINDRQIDDQRVEAHLADCASCRNRLLGFHRSLFTGVADSPEADPSGNDTSPSDYSPSDQRSADAKLEGARPTDSALADSNFANSNDPVDPKVRTAPTPECPSTEALRELAAGLIPGDLAPALTRHAATCDHCGPLLRAFTEDFSDDFTPEEQAVLNNLQSSSADWQKNTAREMLEAAGASGAEDPNAAGASAAQAGGSATIVTAESGKKSSAGRQVSTAPDRKPISWKWALVPAAAAVVAVAAFSIWYTQRDTPEKVETLLAQAYSEHRTTQMRWPGAEWRQYEGTRGKDGKEPPISLLEAEHAIEGQSETTQHDAGWIRVAAETKIIAGEPRKAIPVLEQELRSHPASVPLLLDLATAYFSLADQESCAKSRALLDSVLQQEPNNAVALFNRALVLERINDRQKAEEDWNAFLNIEKDPRWLAEAQKHREDLRQLK
jgi:tetratricopeptide (TPR) repeat protein